MNTSALISIAASPARRASCWASAAPCTGALRAGRPYDITDESPALLGVEMRAFFGAPA